MYIGIDEAGVGALAGPLMVCGVVSGGRGCGDSKKYTRKRREALYTEITTTAPDYLLLYAEPEAIDRLGIWGAWDLVVSDVVRELRRRNGPLHVHLDGARHPPVSWVKAIVGGDGTDPVIGAASVVAKVTRDRLMQQCAEEYPDYGWDTNMGYGTAKHIAAIHSIGVSDIHRSLFVQKFVG